jgi:hypothetical protein
MGVLTTVIEGHTSAELYMTAIDRNLVSDWTMPPISGGNWPARSTQRLVQDAAPEPHFGLGEALLLMQVKAQCGRR